MILIQNARIIDPANQFDEIADILIDDKKISRIDKQIDSKDLDDVESVEIIDATGKILTPGLVDMHAHLREPGQESRLLVDSQPLQLCRILILLSILRHLFDR